jgi:hypothetical protein
VVRHDVGCPVEPEVGDRVQGLALERDRSQDLVKSRLPICRDDRPNAILDLAVAHLALVRLADSRKVRSIKSPLQLQRHSFVRNHQRTPILDSQRAYRFIEDSYFKGASPMSGVECR